MSEKQFSVNPDTSIWTNGSTDKPACTSYLVLRHTCASHLAKTSKNLLVVQKQLGHADIKTTMKYAHLADETHREEVERLAGEVFG